jgi:hypothetical protein
VVWGLCITAVIVQDSYEYLSSDSNAGVWVGPRGVATEDRKTTQTMWYVTFHGVGSNYNIYAYDDSGNLLTTSVLKVSSAPKDGLPDEPEFLLYVSYGIAG